MNDLLPFRRLDTAPRNMKKRTRSEQMSVRQIQPVVQAKDLEILGHRLSSNPFRLESRDRYPAPVERWMLQEVVLGKQEKSEIQWRHHRLHAVVTR